MNGLETRLGCDLRQMTIIILIGSDGAMTQDSINTLQNLALEGVQVKATIHAAYIDYKGLHDHLMTMVLVVVARSTKAAIGILVLLLRKKRWPF
jgi:hypothetical protein